MSEQSAKQLDEGLSKLRKKFKCGNPDDEFAQKYFNLLIGQYKTISKPENDPAALSEAESIIKIPATEIEWEQIYRLELAIIKLEPVESLCRRAWILRSEYDEIASEKEKLQYKASNPPEADPASINIAALRADLTKIQEELNWAYIVLWVYEEFRSKLTRMTVITTIGVTVLAAVLFLVLFLFGLVSASQPAALLFAVAFAGMIGGLVSTLHRIQTAKLDGNSDLSLVELEKGQGSIYISPFLGAIFAVVLYGLFAGGLLKGTLFPDFDLSQGNSIGCFATELNGLNQAKLLVWSFIAGFAEQLVPDRLNQLSKRTSAADKEK